MKKISLLLVVVLMLSAFMTGCGGGDKSSEEGALPETIKIGVLNL